MIGNSIRRPWYFLQIMLSIGQFNNQLLRETVRITFCYYLPGSVLNINEYIELYTLIYDNAAQE